MGSIVTKGIVLARTDFQEADRIITLLTPHHGKVKVIVKGVRRQKSKLAAGVELFSISQVTYLPGSREIGTLISSRLETHYGNIVKDIQRTMTGYELLKRVNRATEDAPGEEYFVLLNNSMRGLNEPELALELVELWFSMQLLKISGHSPHLSRDAAGNQLDSTKSYLFDFEEMYFQPRNDAPYSSRHIKLLRLASGLKEPDSLKQITDAAPSLPETLQLARSMLAKFIRA